jgi:hypothetical protein
MPGMDLGGLLANRRRAALAAAVVVIVAGLAVLTVRMPWRHPTFSVDEARVTGSLWAVSEDQALALMPEHNPPLPGPGGQMIAGTVTWTPPPDSPGMYMTLYLIDKRTGKAPGYWCATSDEVIIGGDPSSAWVAQHYPWLSAVGPVQLPGGGWTWYATGLVARASMGSVTFIARFPVADPDSPDLDHYSFAPIQASDLALAVVYHDDAGHVAWVDRAAG